MNLILTKREVRIIILALKELLDSGNLSGEYKAIVSNLLDRMFIH